MNELTAKLQAGQSLEDAETRAAATWLLEDSPDAEAVSDRVTFLRALATKGETPQEITAFAQTFLEKAVDPGLSPSGLSGPLIDVCGTGGDKLGLFNVSTTSMFPLAAAGAVVVKHGNRGITSKSGGADVLEALGVRIDGNPAEFVAQVQEVGLSFLFAPLYHPAFKAVVPVRKELAAQGQRTVFNILGPLLNPVRPDYQLTGVFSPSLPEVYADILTRLGRRRAWAVHGSTGDGRPMDEMSTLGPTLIRETRDGEVQPEWTLHPEELDLAPATLEDLQGGDAEANARILLDLLEGRERGPKRDLVLLNAGAALTVCGLAPDLAAGMKLAAEKLDDGSARAKLEAMQSA